MSESRLDTVLRNAWSNVRLDALRTVVQQTIGSLEELDPKQVLGREPSASEMEAETGSVRAARDTCCHELRDGCGLPLPTGQSVFKDSVAAPDVDWSQSYSSALDGYRNAACEALEASLALPPDDSSDS